jgi:hypothetical protein
VAEGLSPTEVGKEIGEHAKHHAAEHADDKGHPDRWVSIAEAVLLSIVTIIAAWSGFSAAKWSTHSSLAIAKASATRAKAGVDEIQAIQIRTLDSVSFNAVETAYVSGNKRLFDLAIERLRPGYRAAVNAWIATRPLKNPHAPPGPSYMPQYRIPQEGQYRTLNAQATAALAEGQSAAHRADEYVQLTVLLAAVLFLVGIGSRFPVRVARYGLVCVAAVLLVVSVVQLLGLPGPPS